MLCQVMVLADAFYYVGENGERDWVCRLMLSLNVTEKPYRESKDAAGHELVPTGHEQNVQVEEQRYRPAGDGSTFGADTVRCL
ncbi:hypothetical protein ACNKHT_04400 [Shigella flexneri]